MEPQSPSHPLTTCPYSHPRKSAASLKNHISACESGIYSRGYWHVRKEGRVFVLWVEDGWWGITTLTKLMIQFVAAHFDSHGFTFERGFWRQVRFSVGCFGGSVLRFGSFVRGRLWPGRKLTRRCHFFGERIPEEAWSDSSDVWGLTHGRGCFANERLGLHIRRSSWIPFQNLPRHPWWVFIFKPTSQGNFFFLFLPFSFLVARPLPPSPLRPMIWQALPFDSPFD